MQFELGQQFRLVQDEDGWHVSTVAYRYQLLDENDGELIAWHWHPGAGPDHPHIHVPAGPINRHVHVPTGRVSIETVLRLLLTDLEVPARRPDHGEVLDETEARFIQYRRWHAAPGSES
jgi:hypothetical protein